MNIVKVDKEFSDKFRLIHFGSNSFIEDRFTPITNASWVKPRGGLWTSPEDSTWGWKHWCDSEKFVLCSYDNSFVVRLKENSKILKIDSEKDLSKALDLYGYGRQSPLDKVFLTGRKYLNFEKIRNDGYSSIWLTTIGEIDTRFSEPSNLYGWDCESVLILNKESILYGQ